MKRLPERRGPCWPILRLFLTVVLVCIVNIRIPALAIERTDLNLVLALDCSWSVNPAEYTLQIGGLAKAFADTDVQTAIAQGKEGRIGVAIIQWSVDGSQPLVLPWMTVSTPSDALALASRIARLDRQTVDGGTSISAALERSYQLLRLAPFVSSRHVIDIVADGENNNGPRIEQVRDRLVAAGIVINALAVVNEVHWLHHYLRNRVIGGPSAFVEKADDYDDFARAMKKKLLREIRGDLIGAAPDGGQRAAISAPPAIH